jgi:autotransporter-associated beta strand protein
MVRSFLRQWARRVFSQGSSSSRRKPIVRPLLETLESRLTPAVRTWDGGSLLNDNWKEAKNWEDNIAPVAGDDLRFPSGIIFTDRSTVNDFPVGTNFKAITISDDYTFTGNALAVGDANTTGVITITNSSEVSMSIGVRSFVSALTFDVGSGSQLTFSGKISPSVVTNTASIVSKSGAGTMTMTGSQVNTYGDETNVNEGVLVLNRSAGVTCIPDSLFIANGRVDVVASNQIVSSSDVTVGVGGRLRLVGVSQTLGDVTLRDGGSIEASSNSVVVTDSLTRGNSDSTGKITVTSGSTLTTDTLSLGQDSIVTLGIGGTLGAGDTTLRDGSSMSLDTGSVFNVGPLHLTNTSGSGAGTLVLGGNVDLSAAPSDLAHLDFGRINLAGTRTFTVSSGSIYQIAAIMQNGGLIKEGAGELRFTGDRANTYTGLTSVNAGKLTLFKTDGVASIVGDAVVGTNPTPTPPDNAAPLVTLTSGGQQFATSARVTVNSTGHLQMIEDTPHNTTHIAQLILQGGTVTTFRPDGFTPGAVTSLASSKHGFLFGDVEVGQSFAAKVYDVADGAAVDDLLAAGALTGGGSLRKTGPGKMSVEGANTSTTEEIVIEGGTFALKNVMTLSNFTLNGGNLVTGGLKSSGQGAPSAIIKNLTANVGTVQPGGPLFANAPVSFKSGSTFSPGFTVGPTGFIFVDKLLASTGVNVSLGDTPTSGFPKLDLRANGALAIGTQVEIVTLSQPSQTLTGKFKDLQGNTLNEGSSFTAGGQTFVISYVGGDGNDVVVIRDNPPAFQNRSVTTPIVEGQVATVTGTITEADAGDTFFLDVKWGDGTPLETFTFPAGSNGQTVNVTHRYRDNGDFTINLLWRDQHGGFNTGTLAVHVDNATPTLSDLSITPDVLIGQRAVLTGAISDPGTQDTFTLVIDWGDGSRPETIRLRAGTERFALVHHYAKAGDYQVSVSLSDDDGGSDTDTLDVGVRSRR